MSRFLGLRIDLLRSKAFIWVLLTRAILASVLHDSPGGNMSSSVLAWVLSGTILAVSLSSGIQKPGQVKFGQPRSVIHVVAIRWNSGVSESDKEKVIDGVRVMAAAIPGVKNVWLESERVQPNDLTDAFAIEFESRSAAEAYVENPAHKDWLQLYLPLRASSNSIEISNR